MSEFTITEDGILTGYTGTDTTVVIPDGVRCIWNSVLTTKHNAAEVIVPGSVESIRPFAFSFSHIERIKLTEGLKHIGRDAFWGCRELKEIVLPNGLEHLGANVFWSTGVETAVLPDSIAVIGECVFKDCDKLRKVVFPKDLKAVCGRAFEGCSALEEADIPQSLEYVAKQDGCGLQPLTALAKQTELTVKSLTPNVSAAGKRESHGYAFMYTEKVALEGVGGRGFRLGGRVFTKEDFEGRYFSALEKDMELLDGFGHGKLIRIVGNIPKFDSYDVLYDKSSDDIYFMAHDGHISGVHIRNGSSGNLYKAELYTDVRFTDLKMKYLFGILGLTDDEAELTGYRQPVFAQ